MASNAVHSRTWFSSRSLSCTRFRCPVRTLSSQRRASASRLSTTARGSTSAFTLTSMNNSTTAPNPAVIASRNDIENTLSSRLLFFFTLRPPG